MMHICPCNKPDHHFVLSLSLGTIDNILFINKLNSELLPGKGKPTSRVKALFAIISRQSHS
uniref:Uncharacterized protein n=1 Tax=Rhizophora mucronata TaxID=61149 RepID=A0A2P2QMZ8_RHIMU